MLLAGVAFALASAAVFLVADSVPMLLVGRVFSGLSAGIFTGTATAAVIEAAPEKWRSQSRGGGDGRQHRRAGHRAAAGRSAGPIRACAIHLSFIVHIVLAALAGIAVLIVPETSQRTGRIGVQRLTVPVEVRAVFVVASLAAFARARAPSRSTRGRTRCCCRSRPRTA